MLHPCSGTLRLLCCSSEAEVQQSCHVLGPATASTTKRSRSSGHGDRTTCWGCLEQTQRRLGLGPASLQQAPTVLPFCALPQAYANSLVDHHLVLDLLPGLAGAYFARRLPVSLTYGQVRACCSSCQHATRSFVSLTPPAACPPASPMARCRLVCSRRYLPHMFIGMLPAALHGPFLPAAEALKSRATLQHPCTHEPMKRLFAHLSTRASNPKP